VRKKNGVLPLNGLGIITKSMKGRYGYFYFIPVSETYSNSFIQY